MLLWGEKVFPGVIRPPSVGEGLDQKPFPLVILLQLVVEREIQHFAPAVNASDTWGCSLVTQLWSEVWVTQLSLCWASPFLSFGQREQVFAVAVVVYACW